MKHKVLLLGCLTFNTFIVFSQSPTINLMFEKEVNTKKYIDSKNQINFYLNNEHFISIEQKTINSDTISKVKFTPFNRFIDLSNLSRQKLIKEGEKSGVVKILSNSDVFNKIYIYEKTFDSIWCRHRTIWIDEIID